MSDRVKVLNYADVPMYFTDWTEAISNVYIGRAEIVEACEEKTIGMVDGFFPFPKIIRFKSIESVIKNHKRKIYKFSRNDLFVRDEGVCQYCEKTLAKESATVDHIVPRSRGGSTSWENCVLSCSECNCKKGNRTPTEAGMRLLKIPIRPQTVMREYRRR